jgi:chondroitin sulfate proteoglycan 4
MFAGSRPSLMVLLTGPPSHGELLVRGGGVAEGGALFTQRQLDSSEITYQHDHSDTESDEIMFSLILQGSDHEEEGLQLYNGTITITVRPINDQPFSLQTHAPNISVVQGQSRAISPAELNTIDLDTPPQHIIYDVISGPSQGRLVLVYRQEKNGTTVERVETAGRFSQEDINTGKLIYEHTGTLQPASFYFRVSDGQFNPVYTVFNIQILKLNLTSVSKKDIPIQQGSSVTFVTNEHLDILTNGQREKVKYNVTHEPRHGKIYLRDVAVQTFGQNDVDHRHVMYMQTDMTTSTDTFAVIGWLPGTDVTSREHHLNVTVEPLLLRGNFTAIAGTKNQLGLGVLDATPLAKLTNSNPTYEVIKKPRLGRIKKIIRITTSGEGNRETRERERDVGKFSHEEIKSGVIYYVARRGVEASGAEESVILLLSGSIFQPAQLELRFPVRHERAAEHHAPGSGPTASVTPPRRGGSHGPTQGDSDISSPNMITDYILLLGVASSVVLLAIMIVIGVRCRNSRAREDSGATNGKADHAYGPNATELVDTAPTLPRPPDHLLPLSPRPPRAKRFINANGSTHFSDSGDSWRAVSPIPVSIPQCKVIPLDSSEGAPPSSTLGSDVDVNTRYPYGVSDDQPEDWSSYDTQSDLPYPPRTTNPMLRRNQYWV